MLFRMFLGFLSSFVFTMSFARAESPQLDDLKKIIAIQTAELQNLKSLVKQSQEANAQLKRDIDRRFKTLSLSIGPSETYQIDGQKADFVPRGNLLTWKDHGDKTGFHCPPNTVSSGADLWLSNYFHRSYCRPITLNDKGW